MKHLTYQFHQSDIYLCCQLYRLYELGYGYEQHAP